ncbi:hypothetical protein BH23ACT9_BH23ACT9_08790 [soil metagenome]
MPDELAVILDFGGVMTGPVTAMFKRFAASTGLTPEQSHAVIGRVYAGGPAGEGPIQQLELGAITPEDLAAHLADAIREVTGRDTPAEGLFEQMWGTLELDATMVEGVRRLRHAGVRTALLSNSWGANNYPFQALEGVFDTLVISGTERIRKPDPAIYRLALQRLDLPASACAFVDDLTANVAVAAELGIHGVLHTDPLDTLGRLQQWACLPEGSLTS